MKTALVAGGGLAGMSAACALADAGWKVTLLERRKRLGGMVASFPDPAGGGEVDNGEHIAIAACTALLGFADRLGVADAFQRQPSLRIPFVGTDGRVHELTESAWSFLTFGFLSLSDRWRVARAVRRIGALTDAEIARLDHIPCSEWLADDLGQTPEAIARFWEYFVCPALNEPCRTASAGLSARVLRDGMGADPRLARFALFTRPLGTVFGEAARAYLEKRGGEVRPLATLRNVIVSKGHVEALLLADQSRLHADAYVLALAHADLAEVLPELAAPLEHSPIVNAHLWYDRAVTQLPFGALVDCRIHWFFNRSVIQAEKGPGQHLSFSLSAARDVAHQPAAEIAAACDAEVKRRFDVPAALVRYVVSREHRATFAARPGTAPLRHAAKTRFPNLYLAGAWTDTGYPATMEGAVRSGQTAAKACGSG